MLQPTQRGLTRSSTSYDLLPSKNNKILPDIVRCHQRRLCQDKDPADRSAGKMLRRWEWDGYTAVSDTTLVPVSTVPKWGSTTNVCGIPNHQVSNITGFWEGLNGWPDQRFRMEHTANVAIQVFGLAPTWLGKKKWKKCLEWLPVHQWWCVCCQCCICLQPTLVHTYACT